MKTDKFGAYSRHQGPGCNIGETKYREKKADAHRKQTTMKNFQQFSREKAVNISRNIGLEYALKLSHAT